MFVCISFCLYAMLGRGWGMVLIWITFLLSFASVLYVYILSCRETQYVGKLYFCAGPSLASWTNVTVGDSVLLQRESGLRD